MHWNPPIELSEREEDICARWTKQRRFFPFLRRVRHALFEAAFQAELEALYSTRPRGTPPLPAAFLTTVVWLQAYTRGSDFEAVSKAWHDARWQRVLDIDPSDLEQAPFGETTLVDFRHRLVRSGMAARLLHRTVDRAKATQAFGYKQVAGLRIALDSVPLDGAGKVEDTINLRGHAMRLRLQAVAAFRVLSPTEIAAQARLPVLMAPSLKAGLDLDWHAPEARHTALTILFEHLERRTEWRKAHTTPGVSTKDVEAARTQLHRIVPQDTEADGQGGHRIVEGVAPDRQIALNDPAMRHGRKRKTERIDGYKVYFATDLDQGLTRAAGVLPANVPEAQGADKLAPAITAHGTIQQLAIDTAFFARELATTVRRGPDTERVCRPLRPARRGLFTQLDFTLDLAAQTVSCPVGHLVVIQGPTAQFPDATCAACPERAKCQKPTAKHGRTIALHPDEGFFQAARVAQAEPEGRAPLRERVAVEPTGAHQRNRQGRFARYFGVAHNDFDVQRIAAVNNLLVIDRHVHVAEREALAHAA